MSVPRVAVGLLVLAIGCHGTPTQLVVHVDTTLAVPSEIDNLIVRTRGADGGVVSEVPISLGTLDGQHTLPGSFGLVPADGAGAGRTTEISVDVRRAQCVLFTYIVRTGWIAGESLRLDVHLARECAAIDPSGACTTARRCDNVSTTCGAHGACVAIDVPPSSLSADAGP